MVVCKRYTAFDYALADLASCSGLGRTSDEPSQSSRGLHNRGTLPRAFNDTLR
jgi:hypothetical protein